MKMNRLLAALAGLVPLLGGGAVAASPDPQAPVSVGPRASTQTVGRDTRKSEKLICKTTEMTGSRLGGTRTCMTRQQWDDISQSDRQAIQGAQFRNNFAGAPGSSGGH